MSRSFTTIDGSRRTRSANGDVSHVVRRIRTIINNTALDCDCRERVDGALQHFEALERARHQKQLLDQARSRKRRIAALLELLRDIDEIGSQGVDSSVLVEASLLFEDIAAAAKAGSRALRRISPGQCGGETR